MDDRLQQLLKTADASAPLPNDGGDLPGRVWDRQKRRQRTRAIGSAIVVLLAIGALFIPWRKYNVTPTQNQPTIANRMPSVTVPSHLASSLASLNTDIELHSLTADKMLAAIKPTAPRRPTARSATPVAVVDVQFQRDQAALILVYDAEQHAKANRPQQAVAAFRRTIELFPKTHWADVARQRLKQLQA